MERPELCEVKGQVLGAATRVNEAATLGSLPTHASLHAAWPASSPVMVHEHVDNVLEQVGLFRGEEAAAQLFNDLPELRNSVVVLLGIVPARAHLWSAPSKGCPASQRKPGKA